ncbi:hypothetical protein CB1_001792024 [Camelus ferus]|nr:hypothetical protein CB1_001792024 [Camelus ferus]
MDSLSTANTEFCLDVFKELNSNNAGDNIFFSPLSLLYALSMILLGARGNSARQMEKCSQTGKIHSEFGVLFSQINRPDSNYTLSIASRLYGTKAMAFHQVEEQLNAKTFSEWTSPSNLVEQEVEVHLPRFKLDVKYELNSLLKSLGMTDIFSQVKADLSGISPTEGLFVTKVIHKSYVDVNEEGTEAAAATGVIVVVKRLPIRAQFMANHPFLFFIRHIQTNTILFCGKLASP